MYSTEVSGKDEEIKGTGSVLLDFPSLNSKELQEFIEGLDSIPKRAKLRVSIYALESVPLFEKMLLRGIRNFQVIIPCTDEQLPLDNVSSLFGAASESGIPFSLTLESSVSKGSLPHFFHFFERLLMLSPDRILVEIDAKHTPELEELMAVSSQIANACDCWLSLQGELIPKLENHYAHWPGEK